MNNVWREDDRKLIRAWQAFLKQQGFDPGQHDGEFGEKTEAATRAFQEANKIAPDGVAGPHTLNRALAKGFRSPAEHDVDVLKSELAEIMTLRKSLGQNPDEAEVERTLAGIAFSGGGIRSATFGLGVIQALAKDGLLHRFDYVSSVSGGGYLASWLAAWCQRTTEGIKKVEEKLRRPDDGRAEPAEVHFLRRYSNYLTPQVGTLSGDAWALVGIYLRNLFLNLCVLILSLSTILLIPRVFVLGFHHLSQGVGADKWFFLGAGICLTLIVTLTVGSNLQLFAVPIGKMADERGTGWGHLALHLYIVLPFFVAAALLCIYLRGDAVNVRTPYFWMGWTAGIHTATWLLGYIGIQFVPRKRNGRLGPERAPAPIGTGVMVLLSAATSGAVSGIGIYGLAAWVRTMGDQPGTLWHLAAFGPTLGILVFLTAGIVQVGTIGSVLDDFRREWLGRMGGLLLLYALLWACLFGVAFYIPLGVKHLLQSGWIEDRWNQLLAAGTLTSWLGITLGGVAAGFKGTTFKKQPRPEAGIDSQSPDAKPDASTQKSKLEIPKELLMSAAPYVFVAGLLVLLSFGVDQAAPRVFELGSVARFVPGRSDSWHATVVAHFTCLNHDLNLTLLIWLLATVLLAVVLAWRVDINEFSMHHLYRNRLIRCYLGASNSKSNDKSGERRANTFTGLDPADDVSLEKLAPSRGHIGPYHIFNTALNLVHGQELAWQKRRASSFVMSPCYCGYHRRAPDPEPERDPDLDECAYVPTREYTAKATGPSLGTAMAISGAAASPNMGYYSTAALAFLMTVFNVRLGWWLPNPRARSRRTRSGPGFGLLYLFFELFGLTSDRRGYVYLSDGGHFENLGLYELVRRRCRTIVVCDASADGAFSYDDLANAVQKCRVDLGVNIRFPEGALRRNRVADKTSHEGVVQGIIDYGDGRGVGWLFYLKPTTRGVSFLPTDVRWYGDHVDKRFPHQSTADQWFNEAQFESYRALGDRILTVAVDEIKAALDRSGSSSVPGGVPLAAIKKVVDSRDKQFTLDEVWVRFPDAKRDDLVKQLTQLGLDSGDGGKTWGKKTP